MSTTKQVASSYKRPIGSFPGKPEANPKKFCYVILSNNEDVVDTMRYPRTIEECHIDENKQAIEEIARVLYG